MTILENTVPPETAVHGPHRQVFLLGGASLLTAAGLSVAHNQPYWFQAGFNAELFWAGFLAFLLPVMLSFFGMAVASRFLLPGETRVQARRALWTAFLLRVACVLILPLALHFWGDPNVQMQSGFLFTDAYNASQLAGDRAGSEITLVDGWDRGKGDNTGGLATLGMAAYRLFSPAEDRPLMMDLMAAVFSALTVAAAFRLGELQFSRSVGVAAAWLTAFYPEAIFIGAAPIQQAYLAMLFGWMLYCFAAIWKPERAVREGVEIPRLTASIAGLLLAAAGTFFISSQFFILSFFFLALVAVWLADPKTVAGKIIWISAGGLSALLILLTVLSQLDVIPAAWDILKRQTDYLFGAAWTEFDKMLAEGRVDMLETFLSLLPRSLAFWMAGVYGIFQPVLPAAIAFRRAGGDVNPLLQSIGVIRAAGWYSVLPFALYGALVGLRGIRNRTPLLMMAGIFWINAFASSYRSLGDQWDNPRYRLFALVPMVLVVAWAWIRWREYRDPWMPRLLIPFLVGLTALTGWYVFRYWIGIVLPPLPAFGFILAACILAGLLTLWWTRKTAAPVPH